MQTNVVKQGPENIQCGGADEYNLQYLLAHLALFSATPDQGVGLREASLRDRLVGVRKVSFRDQMVGVREASLRDQVIRLRGFSLRDRLVGLCEFSL